MRDRDRAQRTDSGPVSAPRHDLRAATGRRGVSMPPLAGWGFPLVLLAAAALPATPARAVGPPTPTAAPDRVELEPAGVLQGKPSLREALGFSPDGRSLLACNGPDGRLQLWEL